MRADAGVRVPGQQHDIAAQRQHALAQRPVQHPAHRARALGIAMLEVGPGDAVGEQRVAGDQRGPGDQQAGHVARVARERDRTQRDPVEVQLVAVAQWLDLLRVRDPAFQGRRREAQRRAGGTRQRAGAGQVVGVQVGVEDVGDGGAELARQREVVRGVGRGVDDERARSGNEEVGQAAASGPLHLPDKQARDPKFHRARLQQADPPPHSALQHRRVDALFAQRAHDRLGDDAAVADDRDRPVQFRGDGAGVGEHRVRRHVPRPR